MPSPSDVPFARSSGFEASGFESAGPAPAPKEAAPTQAQIARAEDLFLRTALSPDELARAKASRGGFEAVVGRPNFLPASFLEIGAASARATCQVRTSGVDFTGRSGSWTGTGFLLGGGVLVTNNHVLNSPAVAAAASAVFDYQVGPDGAPLPPRSFALKPDRLFLTSPAVGGLDYTFVAVHGDPSPYGGVRVRRTAFAIAEGEFANVVSHPNGRMKEVALQENEVRWQDDVVIHYTSDTEGGSSGASVCNNSWDLVALHHASKPSNVPGFAALNEGIKLAAIAADLERLARGGSAAAAAVLALFDGTDERLGFFGGLGRPAPAGATGLESVVDSFRGTEADLDVGFWNVEWLTKHYDTKKQAVARVLREMNLDVWALSESSPNAAAAVAAELKSAYGLTYATAAAEPESTDGKQSCTLIWNTATVTVKPEAWGEPVETWLKANSRDFDDLGLGGFEAVHGKIFDRYPALFRVTGTKPGPNGATPDFYLVPLHLKAMGEGSLRRKMASKILAEAVKVNAEAGGPADFVIGGDANAPLDTGDFANLTASGLVAASAEDAAGGAFSYIKGPKSLIDHVFLSPNLAGDASFFVVAADRTFPHYLREISDHRPVLVRFSLGGGAAPTPAGGFEGAAGPNPAMDDLKRRLAGADLGGGFEARRGPSLTGRTGYDPAFLGGGAAVPLPPPPTGPFAAPAVVAAAAPGVRKYVLDYTHFSVVMNAKRRMPYYCAVNIDGRSLKKFPRGDAWFLDPRIKPVEQAGDELYRNNDLDRGHMVRRLDPVWGPDAVAQRADADTFCFTNACPQHKDLNQKEWARLEDYVLDNARAEEFKVCVLTGPVFAENDPEYRGFRLPQEFWKILAIRRGDTGKLSVTGYMLSQKDMISGFEFAYGKFKTYQVKVSKIAALTGLDFTALAASDPLVRGGFESTAGGGIEVTGAESLVF